jgi:hypothetical protein
MSSRAGASSEVMRSSSTLISRVRCALLSASVPTSRATTAKPSPCSPARAASIEALKARQLRLARDVVDHLAHLEDRLHVVEQAVDALDRRVHLGLQLPRGLLALQAQRAALGGDALHLAAAVSVWCGGGVHALDVLVEAPAERSISARPSRVRPSCAETEPSRMECGPRRPRRAPRRSQRGRRRANAAPRPSRRVRATSPRRPPPDSMPYLGRAAKRQSSLKTVLLTFDFEAISAGVQGS